MSGSLIIDSAMQAAQSALDGLNLQQQAISRNIANIDTPGYRAETVNFEDVLKRVFQNRATLAMNTTDPAHLTAPDEAANFMMSQRPGGSVRADQNDVDIDVELTDMAQNQIQYQALTESVSNKFTLLKNIVADK
ncbi:MAG: flagellar basal body rod protein FlgB [Anaerolineaceae bacterium]|nr:flagellar basal body rod protein FlgB [Anaerolineaceae bacterium]